MIDLTTPEIKYGSGAFAVNSSGHLTAKGGGSIAGWTIDDDSLFTGSKSSNSNVRLSSIDFARTINNVSRSNLRIALGNKFAVASDGTLYAQGGYFSGSITGGSINIKDQFVVDANGNMTAKSGAFTGTITSSNGTIGGWTITGGKIYGGDSTTGTAVMQRPSSSITWVFAAGGKSHDSYSDCPFRVSKDGSLYAEKGTFSGRLNAASGTFSGKIVASKISISTTESPDTDPMESMCYLYNSGYTWHLGTADIRKYTSLTLTASGAATLSGTAGVTLSCGDTVESEGSRILLSTYLASGEIYAYGDFYFRDWSEGKRKPIASVTGDGGRISYIRTNSASITVHGQWGVAGDTEYGGRNISAPASDIRLKENISETEIKSALNLIQKIKLHSFDWKDRKDDKHQSIGFIADELEELDSKLSIGGGYDEDGVMNVKSVDTFYLMGYIVKAIQELSAEIQELKGEYDDGK